SSDMAVEMDNRTGALKFIDRKTGKTILQENAKRPFEAEPVVQERIIYDDNSAHMEETANGKVTVKDIIRRDTIGTSTRYKANFVTDGEKALYGLGSQMEDYMNLKGKTVYLTQHNLKIQIPVLWSTNGYGLLFDAGCAMKYYPDEQATDAGVNSYTMQLEAANELDYYVIMGDPEDVVKGYRELTGQVSLPPKYLFGYIQSKERYVSSDDILRTLGEYRRRKVPIDMIVQDWNYWPEGWGYMKMNPEYYPDPKALADSVHAMNAKLMVSIWPNPQYCPEEKDFRERGYMLEHSVYDAFSPEARKHYWKYANDEFFSRGFDAWWCDSSEPLDGDWNQLPEPENGEEYTWDSQERRWRLNKDILSDAMGAERSSLYSLYHSKGIYENQRDSYKEEDKGTEREKRVVNLTRSSYAGQQKYGTVVWNGDTYASWDSFKKQIPSGLNYMA
ncbi:MAG: alpha-glucosidase, partial [Muribaculaceae bacterium]|nr:alpha-glucosidase [Muribaculaceae bacterium]